MVAIKISLGAGKPFASINPRHPVLHLPDGAYHLTIKVTDSAGNTTTMTRTVVVDKRGPRLMVRAPIRAATGTAIIHVAAVDKLTGVSRIFVDGARATSANVSVSTGRRHTIIAISRAGHRTRLVVRIVAVPALSGWWSGELQGPEHDELLYDPSGAPQTGARLQLLLGVERDLLLLGRLPATWRATPVYVVPLLRAVESFQRESRVPVVGTVGPLTRAALDQAVSAPVRTWRSR